MYHPGGGWDAAMQPEQIGADCAPSKDTFHLFQYSAEGVHLRFPGEGGNLEKGLEAALLPWTKTF